MKERWKTEHYTPNTIGKKAATPVAVNPFAKVMRCVPAVAIHALVRLSFFTEKIAQDHIVLDANERLIRQRKSVFEQSGTSKGFMRATQGLDVLPYTRRRNR